MLSSREAYQPSGRVSWGKLALWLVLTSPLVLLSGYLLCVAFHGGFYLQFFIPLLGGLLAGAAASLTVYAGRCRNRWVGAAVGLVAGLVVLIAEYQFDLAHEAGLEYLHRLDLLPGHVRLRMETDQFSRIRRTPPALGQAAAPANRVSAGLMFLLDGLCVGMIPVFLAWSSASRPFSEMDGRWLHEHRLTVEPEDAREMAEALDRGDLVALAKYARPVPLPLSGKRGEARLYYFPYKRNTPVYLTLRIVDGRPWSLGLSKKLATRVRLTADEAAALAERLRPPGAQFGLLDVEPVIDDPRRVAPAAAIEDLPPAEAGRVLNRRVFAVLTVITAGPLALALFLAIGLVVYVGVNWSGLGGAAKAGAAAVILAGFVASLSYAALYADGVATRIQQRLLAAAIRRRPGALVHPDDPDAVYVGVVPRKNWGRLMLETSTDVGLLKIDRDRRELLFEGDLQRWRIPADSIESCELEEYAVGPPAPNESNVFPVAVLHVIRDGGAWEAPLSPMRTTIRRPTPKAKRQRCRQLRRRVHEELLGGPG